MSDKQPAKRVRPADNPFRVSKTTELAYIFPDDLNFGDLISRLGELGGRGMIWGPKGSGKTTLMLQLEEWLRAQQQPVYYLRLNEEDKRYDPKAITSLTPETLILLDGSEQLNAFRWKRFLGLAGKRKLIASAHGPGRLPSLLSTTMNVELAKTLIKELGQQPPKDLEQLIAAHDGNMREVFFSLYIRD